MIEVVYSKKEQEDQENIRIPKNIRQIGNNQSNKKVYIEDYVMTHLKKKPANEDSVRYGVLLGEVKKGNGNMYIFVKAMVEVREVIENSIIFNDDIWTDIYKDIKQYFENMNIVGWFVSLPYSVSEEMKGIKKIHLDNFAGNDKVCFLSDRTEKEDGFYVYEQGNLKKQQGYYIYYEKNEKMKKYVKNSNNKTNQNVEVKKQNEKQVPVQPKEEQQKSIKNIIKEQTSIEPKRQGRFAYGISGLLIVALLLSTVVMLNNYGELKNIKETLATFNINQQAQVVNEILSSQETTALVGETSAIQETTEEPVTEVAAQVETTEPAPLSEHSGEYHVVKAGQTLYDISVKYYGTSEMVDMIKECNDIDEDYTIIEGQKILLP